MATLTFVSTGAYALTLSPEEEATLARVVTDRAERQQLGTDILLEVIDGLLVNAAIAHRQQDVSKRADVDDTLSREDRAVVEDIYARAIAAKEAARAESIAAIAVKG